MKNNRAETINRKVISNYFENQEEEKKQEIH